MHGAVPPTVRLKEQWRDFTGKRILARSCNSGEGGGAAAAGGGRDNRGAAQQSSAEPQWRACERPRDRDSWLTPIPGCPAVRSGTSLTGKPEHSRVFPQPEYQRGCNVLPDRCED